MKLANLSNVVLRTVNTAFLSQRVYRRRYPRHVVHGKQPSRFTEKTLVLCVRDVASFSPIITFACSSKQYTYIVLDGAAVADLTVDR